MGNTATVVIVADDKTVHASLKQALLTTDYAVEAYASCREFIEHFRQPKKGCLILDAICRTWALGNPSLFSNNAASVCQLF